MTIGMTITGHTGRSIMSVCALLTVLCACSKSTEEPGNDGKMVFRVYSEMPTKAEVTDETVNDKGVVSTFIYESSGLLGTDARSLNPEKDADRQFTGRWLPEGSPSWAENTWGDTYNFWGWAYSPANGDGIRVLDHGKSIQVSQPEDYADGAYVDFLLSYIHKSPALSGSLEKRKTVPIRLEHALAMVEIYVYRAHAMTDDAQTGQDIEITIDRLSIGKLFNTAQMACLDHSFDTDGRQNIWSVVSKKGSATYTRTDIRDNEIYERENAFKKGPMMKFTAIPVEKTDMLGRDNYFLTIDYTISVTQDGKTESTPYKESFNLGISNYGWRSGHRIRYELCINTGISFSGTIADWVDVDYVEGVILPIIK